MSKLFSNLNDIVEHKIIMYVLQRLECVKQILFDDSFLSNEKDDDEFSEI